jgi:hypothetical protein
LVRAERTLHTGPAAFLKSLVLAAIVIQSTASLCEASIIINGDFGTGDLTGWTSFVTSNGDLGSAFGLPDVTLFDVAGNGISDNAAQFQVGEAVYISAQGHTYEGGGIQQQFTVAAGLYTFSADIAAQNISSGANDTAGVFSLMVDGITRVSQDFKALLGGGNINPGQIERSTLFASVELSAGVHELEFEITRPWLNGPTYGNTPLEYLNDIMVVPEPSVAALATLGFVGLLALSRRVSKAMGPRRPFHD